MFSLPDLFSPHQSLERTARWQLMIMSGRSHSLGEVEAVSDGRTQADGITP
jgi:hypothetical protein